VNLSDRACETLCEKDNIFHTIFHFVFTCLSHGDISHACGISCEISVKNVNTVWKLPLFHTLFHMVFHMFAPGSEIKTIRYVYFRILLVKCQPSAGLHWHLPYLFTYKPIPTISRDPKLVTQNTDPTLTKTKFKKRIVLMLLIALLWFRYLIALLYFLFDCVIIDIDIWSRLPTIFKHALGMTASFKRYYCG